MAGIYNESFALGDLVAAARLGPLSGARASVTDFLHSAMQAMATFFADLVLVTSATTIGLILLVLDAAALAGVQ